jgi:RNA polymerase sigma-70 factor (ECF subfamily)
MQGGPSKQTVDSTALEHALRDEGPKLLGLCRRIVDSDADAEDALQEGFMAAARKLEQFDGRSQLSTWLYRVVVNAALMQRRKRNRLAECDLQGLQPAFLPDGHRQAPGPAWPKDPETCFAQRQVQMTIYDALAQLPERARNILVLRDIQGLSGQETAEALSMSAGAVRVSLHRARLALRALLENVMIHEERT